MLRFLAARILSLLAVVWAAVSLTFLLIRLAPGGPFADEKNIPREALEHLNRFYGFDRPLHVQYASYLGRALRGDLGVSTKYPGRRVNEIIAAHFPVSLELGFWALLIALPLGVVAGTLAALRPGSWLDRACMSVSLLGICVPSFVLGPLLILIFAVWLRVFEAAGWEGVRQRILPAVTLAAPYAAYLARLTRAGVLDVMTQDFIRTARSRGLSEAAVVFRHALRPGLLPVVSFLGPAVAGLITGSFAVETVFHVPGLGRMLVMAAFNRDYTLILGLVAFYAALIVLFNALADVLLARLDPRVKL